MESTVVWSIRGERCEGGEGNVTQAAKTQKPYNTEKKTTMPIVFEICMVHIIVSAIGST